MEIKEYVEIQKDIQCSLLKFIDNEEYIEENYQHLILLFEDQKIHENQYELQSLLYLLSKISSNHNRTSNFFHKIEKNFQFFRAEIKNKFTNYEIFDIFKNDKRVLLFLIEDKIITVDEYVAHVMQDFEYEQLHYPEFFFPELKSFSNKINNIQSENFIEKRKIGENDDHVCELIRKDLIEEFITFVTRTSLKLTTKIKTSIFETNSFLIGKEPTLIEYAAFFGSIQIFRYLYINKAELTPSLWIYGVHSNNPELILLLEEIHVEPDSYEEVFLELIKCHHNDIANYILNNFLLAKKFKLSLHEFIFKNNNYAFFPNDLNQNFVFYCLCKYNYITLVELLLKMKSININAVIILTFILFYRISKNINFSSNSK